MEETMMVSDSVCGLGVLCAGAVAGCGLLVIVI